MRPSIFHTLFAVRSRLAALLASILLLTLASPHFGWEAVAGASTAGDHAIAGAPHVEAFHACDVGGDDGLAGDPAHHHHGCAAHQLSHIPAQPSAQLAWHPDFTRQRAALAGGAGFHSFIPSGPDRPPIARA